MQTSTFAFILLFLLFLWQNDIMHVKRRQNTVLKSELGQTAKEKKNLK